MKSNPNLNKKQATMKFITQTKILAIQLLCAVFGHKYKLKKHITKDIHESVCKRCKKEFAINWAAKTILPMDDQLREIHQHLQTTAKIRNSFR